MKHTAGACVLPVLLPLHVRAGPLGALATYGRGSQGRGAWGGKDGTWDCHGHGQRL